MIKIQNSWFKIVYQKSKLLGLKTCRLYGKSFRNWFLWNALKINNKGFWTPLIGKFNASNLLAVFSVADIAGIKSIEILKILSQTKELRGGLKF